MWVVFDMKLRQKPKKVNPQFPNDIYINVMIGSDYRKTKKVLQSDHLIRVHKWTADEVRIMQMSRDDDYTVDINIFEK
jgi:hypothetical protein